ncbi:hypothetical protein [Streptomyces aidingensis]|uniref:Seryl-tRNA synthetase n=1 Tax=Streptomyces aidingensis TaxID=910347 RepID=A0A1I1T391_9ACTN|nr:hypothetical protein [Streptomyces aidingensis]SFD53125.1 Seryl-tRNA synthetase [Streptomyces aidingensis]
MPEYSIPLSPQVPGSVAEEFARLVHYASADIRRFSLVRGQAGEVREILVLTEDETDPAELGRKLNTVVRREVLPRQALPDAAPAEWQSMAVPRPSRIAFADLERAGMVFRAGEGTYGTGGALTDLLSRLEERIRRIAVDAFGAARHSYPALLPTEVLRRAGYFEAFPQFLMSASRFHPDVDAYREFAAGFAEAADKSAFIDSRSEHTGYCLPPTVCYHTFHQFAGREVPPSGAVVTACGKIFRFESHYHRTLERLWDFTMREVVFLGSRETVAGLRRRLMEAVQEWIDRLRLAGHTEVASDPFFSNGATARRVMVQRALKVKYELRMPVVDDRTVAVGSFNIHGTKFGEAFGITLPDGTPAHSGCIGIGLERLAYALLCRHGIDPRDWPEI